MKTNKYSYSERQAFTLAHIRHEILDYRYYCSKIDWLTQKIAEIDARLSSGGVSAVPIVREPKAAVTGNWIVAAVSEQQDLMREREEYCKRVLRIDAWLADLPREDASLVREYLINGKTTDQLSTYPKKVYRAVTRSLEHIAGNF